MERLEGLSQRKELISPSGIEPANFRLIAQSLKQLRHRIALPNIKYLYEMEPTCNGKAFRSLAVPLQAGLTVFISTCPFS
jgi:hypothetical protein